MSAKSLIQKFWSNDNNVVFLISIVVGIIGGLGAFLFRFLIKANHTLFFQKILPLVSFDIGGYNPGIILMPALGGLIVGPIIYKYAREAKGHGVPQVIEAVHTKGGIIRPIVAFILIIVSSITIGSGGSAGQEGPIAQIGAVFGSILGRIFFKIKKYVRLMVACGVAAGISATFNAPLGGAIFAMEIISTKTGLVSSVPILISAVVGDVVMGFLFGFERRFNLPEYVFKSAAEIPIYIAMGIIFGILAFIWAKTYDKIETAFERLKFPEKYKPAVGGLFVGIIGMFFYGHGIMGVGYNEINAALVGEVSLKMLIILGFLKIIATSFSIGSGGSGGIFAPSLFIGAMFGTAFGLIAQSLFPDIITQPYAFTLIGMGALFAGACRAPVTTLIMIPEMTNNFYLFVPMMIVSSLSYFVSLAFTKHSMYMMKLEKKGIKIQDKENILEDVNVSEVMTEKLDYIHLETKVSQLLKLLLETRRSGFPVVDENMRFYGFVKIYDIRKIKKAERENLTVQDVLIKNYPYVHPDDTVYTALDTMVKGGVGRIPVLVEKNNEKYIVGIISKTDVIRAYDKLV